MLSGSFIQPNLSSGYFGLTNITIYINLYIYICNYSKPINVGCTKIAHVNVLTLILLNYSESLVLKSTVKAGIG